MADIVVHSPVMSPGLAGFPQAPQPPPAIVVCEGPAAIREYRRVGHLYRETLQGIFKSGGPVTGEDSEAADKYCGLGQ